ncbi:Mycothiol acetyltransferase [compost metagenome]
MSSQTTSLKFEPVNIDEARDICVAFRADSFAVSFGDVSKFYGPDGNGADKYIEWLKAKVEKDPFSVLHVWLDEKIIGQMELGQLRDSPEFGYVNLFYLTPEHRGRGLGAELEKHAVEYFKMRGHQIARLCVSPTNAPAVSFYKKMGWSDLGPRPGHPEVHFMEKSL